MTRHLHDYLQRRGEPSESEGKALAWRRIRRAFVVFMRAARAWSSEGGSKAAWKQVTTAGRSFLEADCKAVGEIRLPNEEPISWGTALGDVIAGSDERRI